MRRIRFVFALLKAFFVRFRTLLVVSIIVGVAVFLVAQFIVPRLFPRATSYTGVVGRYHPDELPDSILSFVGEGLTRIDGLGIPQPALAVSWKTEENGKTWIFKIDTSKRWHDGTPVTANTIQYSFEDVQVNRPDEETLIFKLQSPYAPFASVVARPTFKRGLVGTGEWKVINLSVVSSFVEKLEMVDRGGAKKIIRFYPSEESAKNAFKLGHVDDIVNVLDPSPFQSWNTVQTIGRVDGSRYVAVFFNTRSNLFKDNKQLRQALAYAISKEDWTGDTRALSPIPSASWAYNAQVKPYDYDIDRAKELLKGVVGKDTKLSIKLTTNPQLLPQAEKIAKDWEALGITTEVVVGNSLPEDYEAFLALYEVSLDPDQYLTWHSTQDQTNITHYVNQRIDKLLEDGRLEMDQEKRKKIYLDFQRFLLEDVPAVFLYHPTFFDIIRK